MTSSICRRSGIMCQDQLQILLSATAWVSPLDAIAIICFSNDSFLRRFDIDDIDSARQRSHSICVSPLWTKTCCTGRDRFSTVRNWPTRMPSVGIAPDSVPTALSVGERSQGITRLLSQEMLACVQLLELSSSCHKGSISKDLTKQNRE